ncbi:fluoride efflux transporter FluC [Corynebacterium ulceribovis]|uniref:fluoride efflux transporter FluC n=1 Tax=Corynebacterium ulceribovis TaxID=487732 RepID=UPI0003739EBF|nr:CrcB family protein [Corynebacterium ulceribovis]
MNTEMNTELPYLTDLASWPVLLLLTAVGAAVGGLTRYCLGVTLPKYVGTLAANIVGSFAFGIAIGGLLDYSFGYLAMLGFAGATSTWSTLAGEIVTLARRSPPDGRAVAYLIVTVGTGVAAAWLGLHLR